MKVIIVALALVAVAAAAATDGELNELKILRSAFDQSPEGAYRYGFETENGIKTKQNGQIKTVKNEEDKPQDVVVVNGFYSYTDPEGNVQTVNYSADETGYHVDGPSVPKVASRR